MTWGGSVGFGKTGWGGGGLGAGLELVLAEAVRENVVRLTFNKPVRFTGVFDPNDAANIARYNVIPVDGTFGSDELPTRDVNPASVEVAEVVGAGGSVLDLTVDRPFSPFPARYTVSVNQLVSNSGDLLTIGRTSFDFDAVFKAIVPTRTDLSYARRDFANPQTLAGLVESKGALGMVPDASLLATFPVDDSGDYAADEGLQSYKKRVYRRLLTRKGAFAHLPGYGVGIPNAVKRLSTPAIRDQLSADAEAQIRQEPETRDVKVTVGADSRDPSVVRVRVRARTVAGENVEFNVPLVPSGGT